MPQNSPDISVFQTKQIYLFKAHELVRHWESTSEALRTYLVAYYTTLTSADIEATDIQNFLTDFKLGKNSLRHITLIEQLRRYDE